MIGQFKNYHYLCITNIINNYNKDKQKLAYKQISSNIENLKKMETKTQNPPITGVASAPQPVFRDGDTAMPEQVQPLPVASSLRKLQVGEKAVFPIEQRSTVLNTITRFRTDYMRQGWDAVSETNKQDFTVIVMRIS